MKVKVVLYIFKRNNLLLLGLMWLLAQDREVQLAYGGESDVWAVGGGVALWEFKFIEDGLLKRT